MEDMTGQLLAAILEVQKELYIETQTIEQFMVVNDICTVEQFRVMREKVSRLSPKVQEISNKLDNINKKIDDDARFDELFMKRLKGNPLTDEEKDFVMSKLDPKG